MRTSHPAHCAAETAADREPGPNQWFKDHLDSVIDAEFLTDRPTGSTGSAQTRDSAPGARR